MIYPTFNHFAGCHRYHGWLLAMQGKKVDVGEWQSLRGDEAGPRARTVELLNTSFTYDIPETVEKLQEDVKPNLPWAEDHFQERVSGEPLNPGQEYQNWPWYKGNVETHKQVGKFSHTYMERYWPKLACGGDDEMAAHFGIRYPYGDLNDVVDLLARSPGTRQAVLPVWFPEDTGAVHGERVPCSLFYHFIQREGKLHIVYTIRSCDFFRHFRDDVYLTCRLAQWVLQQCYEKGSKDFTWLDVKVGSLTMHITSLHIFEAELKRL